MSRLNADSTWPVFAMARDLVGTVFPVSEAVILRTAREHGIGSASVNVPSRLPARRFTLAGFFNHVSASFVSA